MPDSTADQARAHPTRRDRVTPFRSAEPVLRSAGLPAALWAAFVLVHGVLILLCFVAPGWPLGDVDLVYAGWANDAAAGRSVVGIDTRFVYPILAAVPILAALAFGPGLYAATWLGIVTVLNGIAFAFLLGRGRNRRALAAAGWWLGFLLLLGPVALARIDAITAALAIAAVLWVHTRPFWATVLLTIATWVKVWPAALIAALFVVSRERRPVLAAAIGTSAVVAGVAVALGGGRNLFSFVTEQTGRGIQIESPVAAIWMWQAALGIPGSVIYYDRQILTYQVVGTGTNLAIDLMTPLLVLFVAAVLLIGWRASRAGADPDRVFPSLVLALVLTLILFNKVGSPQFVAWLAAPVVLGLLVHGRAWRAPAVLALVIAALTQLVYPYLYQWLLIADPLMMTVLSLRTLLELVLLGWAVRELVDARVGGPRDGIERPGD